jgi:hypothetical protein
MPGTTRRIPADWENPPLFGVFRVGGEVNFLGQSEKLADRWIILLPTSVLAGVLVLLALSVAYGFIQNRKSRREGKQEEQEKEDE